MTIKLIVVNEFFCSFLIISLCLFTQGSLSERALVLPRTCFPGTPVAQDCTTQSMTGELF